jgi:hypothetical protein
VKAQLQSNSALYVAAFGMQGLAMAALRTLVLMVVCALAGCASWSSPTIQAASVDDKQYLGMTCESLKVEKGRIGRQQADLGPTLIPVHDESQREAELSEVSGKVKAIDKVFSDKGCR